MSAPPLVRRDMKLPRAVGMLFGFRDKLGFVGGAQNEVVYPFCRINILWDDKTRSRVFRLVYNHIWFGRRKV